MAEPKFTPSFLRRVAELEKTASPLEQVLLEQSIARIVTNPYLRERFATFYDPNLPSFFLRSGPFMFEFAVDEESDAVTFVSCSTVPNQQSFDPALHIREQRSHG